MTTTLTLSLTWEGRTVRMVGTPEAPEWIARDVCAVLGIDADHGARIPVYEKGLQTVETPGGPQKMATVTEAGLYRLIFTSRRPEAERFKSWVVGEVLPAIRKHGCYPAPVGASLNVDLRDPGQLAALTLQLVEIVNETKARLAVAEPKAEVHDRLTASHGDVALMEAGRLLGQPPKKFLARLEAEGVLFRERGVLHPYAEHLAAGRFRVRVMPVAVDDDGRDVTRVQTLVTPAGLQWLARRYPTTSAVVLQ